MSLNVDTGSSLQQLFFHKYFTSKASLGDDKRQAALKRKSRGAKGGDDDELDGSDAESIEDLVEEGDDQDFEALAEAMEDMSGEEDEQDDDAAQVVADGLAVVVPDEEERAWLAPRIGALLGGGSIGTFAREELFTAWVTFFDIQRLGGG